MLWRYSSGLFRESRMAFLQTRPPRLCATKMRGRDEEPALSLSFDKSFKRFVAWPTSRFNDTAPPRTTYSSYPYVSTRAFFNFCGRRASGQGLDCPAAVQVLSRFPFKPWTKQMSTTALGHS